MEKTKTVSKNKNGFFRELPLKRRYYLESKLKRREFSAGTQIIKRGRSGHFLGIVEHGKLKLENGRTHSRILSRGDYFGDEMLRFGKPSSYTITAQTNSVVKVLDRMDWLSPSPKVKTPKHRINIPQLGRKGWLILTVTASIIMASFILGPTLLEKANNTLPGRFLEAERADLAEKYLENVILLQSDSAKLYGRLGDILAYQNKNDQAEEAYLQAIQLDEYLPWVHNNLGVLLLEEDQADLAAEYFQAAIDLNPESIEAYRNLGDAYYALEEWYKAAAAYQAALEMDFDIQETKAAWAGLILNESRLVEARLVWENVLLSDPRHYLALKGLGVVSLLEGDPALAMMYFDAARYMDPDNPTLRLYIGMALEELRMFDEAAIEYRYVTEMGDDPELVNLAETLLEIAIQEGSNQLFY
jgi:tetratricopeptide (TPR) repeat protein